MVAKRTVFKLSWTFRTRIETINCFFHEFLILYYCRRGTLKWLHYMRLLKTVEHLMILSKKAVNNSTITPWACRMTIIQSPKSATKNVTMEHKQNSLKKSALIERIFRKKNWGHFCCLCQLIYPLSKSGGNRTNSLWVLAFYSVLFKWKNWLEKTALNMSIRRVIFASSQNLKAPFLCQYLIFFTDFFFYIRDLIWIITLTEKSKFEENCRSEGIL